jgi:hypothetical protein
MLILGFSSPLDTIAFSEGGAEAMRIDSDGALVLGLKPQNLLLAPTQTEVLLD